MSQASGPKRLGTSASEGGLSISSRLSENRREKLLNMQKREELKDVLTDRFRGRFGHNATYRGPDEASVTSSCINNEVQKFTTGRMTEANLGRLERRLQGRAQQAGRGQQARDLGSVVSGVSAYSMSSKGSRSVASLAGRSLVGSQAIPEDFDWSRLDEYASHLHEQDALRQRMGTHALQRKMKLDLDAQVAEKRNRKIAVDEENHRYHQNSLVELERWKQTEQIRQDEYHLKLQREKKERDDQLAYNKKLKDVEEQKKKDEETALVDKIITEMEAEQKRFEKKKVQTKKAMRAVFEENIKDQEIKDQVKKEQNQRELDAMKEYARVLDEQEASRAAELSERMDRQKMLMEQLQANVKEQAKTVGDNDAQRAMAQQAEMDRHFFEAESVKQQRLKSMRLENQDYIIKQMGENDWRKDEEKELANIQAQILKRDTDEYNDMERQKMINRKLRAFEHRKEVEEQIMIKAAQRQPEMSATEKLMNKPLIGLVHRTLQERDSLVPDRSDEAGQDC